MENNQLYHHGVLGMKWGVRRYQNKDGTLTNAGKKRKYGISKRQAKKLIRKTKNQSNRKRTIDEYRKSILNNKKYNELGAKSNRIAGLISKAENTLNKKYPDGNYRMPQKVIDLYNQHRKISDQMTSIEINAGKKYINRLNDAKLKDIGYTGSVKKGREMLKAYNLDYKMRRDGYIEGAYVEDKYIRPWNME